MPDLRAASVELSLVRQSKDGTVELCTSFRVTVSFSPEPQIADRDEGAKRLSEELGRENDPEQLSLAPFGLREVTTLDLDGWREMVLLLPADGLAERLAAGGVSVEVSHEDCESTRSDLVATAD